MSSPWSQQLIKHKNKQAIIQLIKREDNLSRAEIVQRLGLSKGTISSLVAELIEQQLILEKGPGESSGGRRPVLLTFNEKAGFSIGIDLGVNYILGVLTDLQGNIFEKVYCALRNKKNDTILSKLREVIYELSTKAPPSPYGIIGIGIGVPGMVGKNNEILFAPNLGWINYSLIDELKEFFDFTIRIENEANAGAYGEKMVGLGKELNNLVYISTGIGIGTGIILNGELFKGTKGLSGEFGHMSIDKNGEKCRCGNLGCWELYASEKYIEKRAMEEKLMTQDDFSLELIHSLLMDNNEIALKILAETAYHLGIGLKNIIHALNPEQIIIGGRLASFQKWIEKDLKEYIYSHTISYHKEDVSIIFSNPEFPSTALGVSAFVIEDFFSKVTKQ